MWKIQINVLLKLEFNTYLSIDIRKFSLSSSDANKEQLCKKIIFMCNISLNLLMILLEEIYYYRSSSKIYRNYMESI